MVLLSEFSKRSEQPSVPDHLCSAHRTASPQLHQHHISMSVSYILYEMKSSTVISLSHHKIFLRSLIPSPVLRDTLLLIERQTGALEAHTEHFFSSILSAMDTLTQPSPGQKSGEEDLSPVGVQGFTL